MGEREVRQAVDQSKGWNTRGTELIRERRLGERERCGSRDVPKGQRLGKDPA